MTNLKYNDNNVIGQFFDNVVFSSRRRHTRYIGDWSSDVCSSDLSPTSSTATPASSSTSRTAASSGSSGGSMWPPGGSHSRSFRWNSSNTRPWWTTKVATRSEERRVGKECRSRVGQWDRGKQGRQD